MTQLLAEAATPAQRQGQQAVGNATEYNRLKLGWNEQQIAAAPAASPATAGAGSGRIRRRRTVSRRVRCDVQVGRDDAGG
jgi:hypothetical protein